MPSCYFCRAESFGPVQKRGKLQVVVAVCARDGSATGSVLTDEVCDDSFSESVLKIQNVVGDAEGTGYAASVVEVVERATASKGLLDSSLIVELH
jgi:hypothetical protein